MEEHKIEEKNSPQNKIAPFYIQLPIYIGIALGVGILLGANLFGSDNHNMKGIIYNINKYKEIIMHVERNYVDTVDVDQLMDYSIEKMLEKLDPHTVYIPPKDVSMANAGLEGNFEGVGIEFNIFNDTLYVVSPVPEGPSEKAGVMAGDKIVKIDGKDATKIDNATVFKKLRGKKGSKVTLGIIRGKSNTVKDFIVKRDKIPTVSVYSHMIDPTTGYIKITRFAQNTYEEFEEALKEVKAKGAKQLMIDLRDNPGGYMTAAVKIADELIAGDAMIVYTDGKGDRFDDEQKAHRKGIFEQGPIVVLINEGSASASEILSGALQDNDRALIVGRRSFGKGLVQMPIKISDGSELRLTISRYYTPSGRSIQRKYENKEAYKNDLTNRYEHGELFVLDSIKFDESQKYKTKKGRTVYGGGGIMPDHFVPLDTGSRSTYLSDLFHKNILRTYATNYYNEHKKTLKKDNIDHYMQHFVVSQSMLNEIQQLAKKQGVKSKATPHSLELIRRDVKAYIAKMTWGQGAFYRAWYQKDGLYNEGLKLFGEASQIAK